MAPAFVADSDNSSGVGNGPRARNKNIKIERKVTVEMARHGWKIAPDGKVYVGSRMMTVSAAREMVRQNKAAQAYAATLPIPLPSWLPVSIAARILDRVQ
jgi:hypothetical protein